jgi:hypothetical protein
MDPFRREQIEALRWIHLDGAAPAYELRDGEATLASLRFARREGSLAEATLATDGWTIKRVGFLHTHITVRSKAEPSTLVGRLTLHWRRILLELPSAAPIFFERAGVSVPAWQALDGQGRRLFHLEPVLEQRRLAGGLVSIDPPGREHPALALLLVLGWYIAVIERLEDEILSASSAALVAMS